MTAHLFRAGRLVDGTGSRPVLDAAVLVESGRVVAAGRASEVSVLPGARDAQQWDCRGQTLIPGLIDGHVHVTQTRAGDPGWDVASQVPSQHAALGLASVQVALAAGVTTLRDAGAAGGVTLELRRLLDTGLVAGARLLACGPLLTTTGGHADYLGVTADTAHELRLAIRRLAHRRPDAVKIVATGGSSDPHSNRHRAQYTVDELAAAVAEAERFGLHVVAHCNATEGIRNAVAAGVRIIAHANFLAAESGHIDADPDVAADLVARGAYVDLNLPAAMVPLADYDGDLDDRPDLPVDRWELLTRLGLARRAFFTSDEHGPRVREFPGLLAAAAKLWSLPAEDVVWRAGGLAASALELGPDYGTLTPGSVADLVVLDGDLVTDLSSLERPHLVFQGGRLAADRGRLVLPAP
ncbi:amidohydrolase family protein [Jiangella mangrovi]|uniref:Imidazolonepropionase-like amidohydrolase n=1 Tax=Jiangella mangrovi TaxID=1524084 RepID=A0A7W9LIX3_9ACTN|nr:amidohydrolase family protein [Jiangella mangrovi]MBB5785487.1 imidazolonepropionase-like amidohydrolase [Jiangella mangrovi]